jgi:cysteine-rich repeat protein
MLIAGFFVLAADAQAQAICGNGSIEGIEECDNGLNNSDLEPDSCRADCTLPRCGDSVTDTGEACDTGIFNNDLIPDQCRTNCALPFCGDGTIDSPEQCDDSGASAECSASCELEALLVCSADLVSCQGERDQCDVDLNACEAASSDIDEDGEHDATDQCPMTTARAGVDNGGCSIAQFCALIDATHRRGRAACGQSDWLNDEPIGDPRDCKATGGACVPR